MPPSLASPAPAKSPPAFTLIVAGDQALHRLARLSILIDDAGYHLRTVRCVDAAGVRSALEIQNAEAVLLDATLVDARMLRDMRKPARRDKAIPVFVLAEGQSYAQAKALADVDAQVYLCGGERLEEQLALALTHRVPKIQSARTGPAGAPQVLVRSDLIAALERVLVRARDRNEPIAYLCLDIQDFRGINRLFGYRVGDTIIEAVGRKLRSGLRSADVIGHLGGDRFGIVLTQPTSLDAALGVARKVIDLFADPIPVQGHSFRLNMVVGVTASPEHGHTADQLLVAADTATDAAKANPTSIASFAGPTIGDVSALHNLSSDLHHAAERDEYLLFYQPKIDIASRTLVGAEGLIRWQHPVRGRLAPDVFIPLAERNGAIEELTMWAIRRALMDRKVFAGAGVHMPISVNLSAASLRSWRIVACIEKVLTEFHASPNELKFEITESLLIHDIERARAVLAAIKQLGPSISIDDFGAGYSSIGYLRALPIDEIKIDRSLIRTMMDSPRDRALVRAVIDLGRSLEFDVVAEGVEDERTLQALADLGCGLAQGYLISPPLPIDKFSEWFAAAHGTPRLAAAGGR